MTQTIACIAMGSNLDLPEGDSAWILDEAVRRLHAVQGFVSSPRARSIARCPWVAQQDSVTT